MPSDRVITPPLLPDFPYVALKDVQRSRIQWDGHDPLEGTGFVNKTALSDVEIVREMTIDDKIDFWHRVMAYGKIRSVGPKEP